MKEISLRIPTSDGAMPVFAAMPQDVALAPGVLIYMDVFGPREELDDIARRFASAGYLAVVPQLFHRLGSPVFAPANRQDQAMDPAAARANQATSKGDGGRVVCPAPDRSQRNQEQQFDRAPGHAAEIGVPCAGFPVWFIAVSR